jgi:hypothetical protein
MLLYSLGGIGLAAQQHKYALEVPGGLAFSEFRGYESVGSREMSFAVCCSNEVEEWEEES